MAGGGGEEKYNVICDKAYGYRKRMIKSTGGGVMVKEGFT